MSEGHVHGGLDRDGLTRAVRRDLGRTDAELASWRVDPVDYPMGSPATHSLSVVSGDLTDGTAWSVFCKVLQDPVRWKYLPLLPPEAQTEFREMFPWRYEIATLTSDLADELPAGFRLPRLLDVVEIDDTLAALWMEHVDDDADGWDLSRYRRAAYLLGAMAAGRRPEHVGPFTGDPLHAEPDFGLRRYVETRVQFFVGGMLCAPHVREHPVLRRVLVDAGEEGLLDEMLAVLQHVPALLARLDDFPHAYAHGDASPQNLLVPRDEPDTFVLIDWGMGNPSPAGFDLGQLVIGLARSGHGGGPDVRTLHETCLPAYVEGLADAGWSVPHDVVEQGYLLTQLLRSALESLPLDLLGAPPGEGPPDDVLEPLLAARVALTRTLLDLCAPVLR